MICFHLHSNRLLREFAFENRLLFDQQQANTRELMENRFRLFLRSRVLPPDSPHAPLMRLFLVHAEGNLETLKSELLQLMPQPREKLPMKKVKKPNKNGKKKKRH